MKTIHYYIFISFLLCISCKKSDFLDKKPSSNLVVPTSLIDFQQLLDANEMIVQGPLGEISTDNYYVNTLPDLLSITDVPSRNAYTWKSDIYQGTENIQDWVYPYKQILNANIVLEGLQKISPSALEINNYNRIKGWAFYIRGNAFYNLARLFAPVYNSPTSNLDLGIPLRLQADVTLKSTRSSVEDTYQQIISDMKQAIELLPNHALGTDRNRPYKSAALGLLARIYLSMRKYPEALAYSNECLAIYSKLIDYNTLSTSSTFPFTNINDETLVQGILGYSNSRLIGPYNRAPNSIVDSTLYKSYDDSDLRKSIFFRLATNTNILNKPQIKIGYTGSLFGISLTFCGVAVDEVLLIKSECLARQGDYLSGLATLNLLLKTRWKSTSTYIDYEANNSDSALKIILNERRKELIYRGLRWDDLRRLNIEGANITLKRKFNSVEYSLPPNSQLYVLPIPPDEIRLSGIQQNSR